MACNDISRYGRRPIGTRHRKHGIRAVRRPSIKQGLVVATGSSDQVGSGRTLHAMLQPAAGSKLTAHHPRRAQHRVHMPPLKSADPMRHTPTQRLLGLRTMQHHPRQIDVMQRPINSRLLTVRQFRQSRRPVQLDQICTQQTWTAHQQSKMRHTIQHQGESTLPHPISHPGKQRPIRHRLDQAHLHANPHGTRTGSRSKTIKSRRQNTRHSEIEMQRSPLILTNIERAARSHVLQQHLQHPQIQLRCEMPKQIRIRAHIGWRRDARLQTSNGKTHLMVKRAQSRMALASRPKRNRSLALEQIANPCRFSQTVEPPNPTAPTNTPLLMKCWIASHTGHTIGRRARR